VDDKAESIMTHPTFDQVCENIRRLAALDSKAFISYTTTFEGELGVAGDSLRELLVGICDEYEITFIRDDFDLYPDQFLFSSMKSKTYRVMRFIGAGLGGEVVKAVSAGDLYTAICRAIDRNE
jgi:hypothetical protein